MSHRKHRINASGRNVGKDQYVSLGYPILKSDAWRDLSGGALKVYFELHTRFYGSNNGKISLGYADAAKLLGLGHATIKRAFDQLEEHGFIIMIKKGRFLGRQASEWMLTTKPYQGKLPTNDWKKWQKKQKPASLKELKEPLYAPL